jgi:serine/threonine protein kinase
MQINGYQVHSRLGVGATSEVFRATHLSTQREVALKRFAPLIAHDPEMRQRLELEAETLATLRHPNIVGLLGVFKDDETWGLELEFVDGKDLKVWSEEHPGPLLEPRLWVLAQVAQGLATAHAQGIVHRDLKPENILISCQGEVKLSDFGLARTITRATITRSGVLLGSLAYMPPEVLSLEDATAASDIYSFGVIAYQLLTGELPHRAESPQALIRQICSDPIPDIGARTPALSERIAKLVHSCLDRDPSKRPESAWHLHAEIMQELMTSGLLRLCPLMATTPISSTHLAEALRIKHQQLVKNIESAQDLGARVRGINALQALFPSSEELPRLMGLLGQGREDKNRSKLIYFMSAVLILLVTGAGLVSLKLKHDPTPAVVEVEAPPVEPIPVEQTPPVVAAPQPEIKPIALTPVANAVEKKITPKPQFGFISFEIPEDVKVFVDGTEVPKLSLNKWRVKPGPHSLRLVREGFEPIRGEVYVKDGEISVVRVGGGQ